MSDIDRNYKLVRAGTTGKDPLVDLVLSTEETDSSKELKSLYSKALALFSSPIKKSYVEACLIAEQDLTKIQEIIEIPCEILEVYRHFFFNVRSLDKLSLLEVIESSANEDERGMKIWALSQGLDFISWRLGKAIALNPVDGLQELFTLSVFKSKEALFSSNSSENSKEATKWTKLSMDLARLLKVWVMDSDAAKTDIELALMSVIPEFKGFDSLS